MEYGQRYFAIENIKTGELFQDDLGNVKRFDTRDSANNYIYESMNDPSMYSVVCLRF